MIKKINTTTVAERTFFEGGSGGGGEGGSGSGAGSGNSDKRKGNEDPHASRAKSMEDSSTKGEKPIQGKPQEDKPQDELGSRGKDKGAEESGRDKGKGKKVFNHLMKITITRESMMTLMHSTSKKKSKKKQKSSLG